MVRFWDFVAGVALMVVAGVGLLLLVSLNLKDGVTVTNCIAVYYLAYTALVAIDSGVESFISAFSKKGRR